MANPRTYVEAPPVTPLPYGLLSAGLVLDDLSGTRAMGVQYEPAFCGTIQDTLGACADPVDFGTFSVSVSSGGLATIDAAGYPEPATYTIDWGDDSTEDVSALDAETRQYAGPGSYVVHVTDDRHGYVATVPVTVTAGQATGPFDAEPAFAKVEHDGIPLVDGDPFALYHLFRCSPVGITEADFRARAEAALRLGEGRALERVLGAQLPVGYHDAETRTGAVDLTPTPGTAVPVAVGLAILEGYAGSYYGGVPVVHAPRQVGSLLATAGSIIRSGARLESHLGAIVAAGGGYDALLGPATDVLDPSTAVAAGPGEAWVYVTGTPVVRRAPSVTIGPVMSRSPEAHNVQSALVERLAVVTWECITAAVLVQTDSVGS